MLLNVSELRRAVFRLDSVVVFWHRQPAILVLQDLADRRAFNAPFRGDILLARVRVLYEVLAYLLALSILQPALRLYGGRIRRDRTE